LSNITMRNEDKPLLAFIEASTANGVPAVPLATTSVLPADEDAPLAKAIAMVKAAGYRIERAKTSKIPRPKKRIGPSCVTEFSDGTVTKMTVFCTPPKLDWDRGERLSIAASQSRWRMHKCAEVGRLVLWAPPPPAIISMRFEELDGTVLGSRPHREQSNA
jgi:hypothetical protein